MNKEIIKPRIHFELIPDSLYSSYLTIKVTIIPNKKIDKIKINFPHDFLIVKGDIPRREDRLKWLISERSIEISDISSDEDVISVNLKLDGKKQHPIVDSSDLNFPLISANLKIEYSCYVEPEEQEYNTQVTIIFPEGCKGYVNHSTIKINDKQYKFSEKDERKLIHSTAGYPKTIVLYSTPIIAVHKNAVIKVETHFRPSYLLFLPPLLLPAILGLPMIAIWAYPGLSLVQRLSFSISLFSIIFATWYKTIPVGMIRFPCLLNHTYIFWILVWTLYAIVLEVFKIQLTVFTFLPYLIIVGMTLFQLYYFYRIPIHKSKWWIIKLNERISKWEGWLGEKFDKTFGSKEK